MLLDMEELRLRREYELAEKFLEVSQGQLPRSDGGYAVVKDTPAGFLVFDTSVQWTMFFDLE